MNKKSVFKKVVSIILMSVLIIGMFSFSAEAAAKKNGLAKVSITKTTKQISKVAEGVLYTVKWKKVKGAKGYQVKVSSREMGEWFTRSEFTSKKSYTVAGSSIDTYKIKVRAYKIVDGKKKYGPWSKVKTIKVF